MQRIMIPWVNFKTALLHCLVNRVEMSPISPMRHALKEISSSRYLRCNLCEFNVLTGYICSECNYFIDKIQHMAHPQHPLKFTRYIDLVREDLNCPGCGVDLEDSGWGWAYCCTQCKFILTRYCAAAPKILTLSDNVSYELFVSFPFKHEKAEIECNICSDVVVFKDGLFYYNLARDEALHVYCAVLEESGCDTDKIDVLSIQRQAKPQPEIMVSQKLHLIPSVSLSNFPKEICHDCHPGSDQTLMLTSREQLVCAACGHDDSVHSMFQTYYGYCPLLKEEQRRNSKKQQELASKAFKKVMKATWGETSDEKSEREDGEGNLALMAKSDTDSDSDSSEVSTPALNEGTFFKIDSMNIPSEPRQELKNSGGTNSETVVSSKEGTGEGTSSDPVPKA
ncbi:hypothetical protein HAX54_025175 [Datura stramonium]|uniref:DC1 domain-containing protein n=1 Tax=Datura stramonium TaxID=4076 RepID=A0ABS8V0Q2_DATST|nr:hypothetical protein [Datura stramonium]